MASRGRVEVLYNGQWGTICDDYWGIAEAHVICRMLNHSGAEFAPRNAFFGPGRRSMPILLDNVKCRGDESTIAACRHRGWGENDCAHSEDASVVCWSESAPSGQGTVPLSICGMIAGKDITTFSPSISRTRRFLEPSFFDFLGGSKNGNTIAIAYLQPLAN